ncbi:MAG: hypothetical protein IKJ14_05040 [Clostridia bacterium]|nr:hypothetical protein [Clostridia bacterium]
MKRLISILTLIISLLCFPACKKGGETLTVYAPDGAPALSLSYAIENCNDKISYNIVGSDVITAKVTGENPVADVAIIPINVASLYLGSGSVYQILGTITHGNFYFLSKTEGEITKQNATYLVGKTIGVVQLPNIPGLTLKATLNDLNVPFNELKNGEGKAQDKVNLIAIKPTEIGVTDCDYYLAPSPAADLKADKLSLNFVGDLGALYSENGFPQAVIVAKKSVLGSNFDKVKAVINGIKASENYLKIDNKTAICNAIKGRLEDGLTPSFNEQNLTENAIKRSSIKFVSAKNSRAEIEEFLLKIKAVNPNAVKEISNDFWFEGEF